MVAIIFTLMSFKFYIFQNLIMSSAKAIVLNDKLYWFLFWRLVEEEIEYMRHVQVEKKSSAKSLGFMLSNNWITDIDEKTTSTSLSVSVNDAIMWVR